MTEQGEGNPANWSTYDALALGIDTNRLPSTDALNGTSLEIDAGGSRLSLFFAFGEVAWRDGEIEGHDEYDAVEVADGTFFIDVWRKSHSEREALTLLANCATGSALSILSRVREHPVPGEPQVSQVFTPGTVVGIPGAEPPCETRDLLGKRLFNDYSPNHLYEHVYLNSERYCWHCLRGVQQGHGDCDLASYYKFADDQYVFAFREFRIPVASVFFLDFTTSRSTGKFIGIEGDGTLNNSYAGAHIQLLSTTSYPDGVEPI